MSIVHWRDDKRRRVCATATGLVTLEDMLGFAKAQHVEGAWTYGVVIDARQARTTMSLDDMGLIAGQVVEMSEEELRGPVAIVAADPAIADINGSYDDVSDRVNFLARVFEDETAAEKWLRRAPRVPPRSSRVPNRWNRSPWGLRRTAGHSGRLVGVSGNRTIPRRRVG
jgi:hypothetical protein